MADIPPSKQSSITLKLKSKDGETFEVDKAVAMQINFVKGMLEDVDEVDGMEIPMGEVEAPILAKVVEFCKFHHQQELNQTNADEIDRWEKSFVQVEKSTLFQLILVCHRLRTVVCARKFSTRTMNLCAWITYCVGCSLSRARLAIHPLGSQLS